MTLRAKAEHLTVAALSRLHLKGLLLAVRGGYLRDSGWLRSAAARRPVDVSGNSQPWLTMPAIRFLDERLGKDLRLFEFGSGGSTAWYGQRTAKVTAVEHHRGWFERIRGEQPDNVELILCEVEQPGSFLELVFRPIGDPTSYSRIIEDATHDAFPDLVVIDGVDRLNCIAIVAHSAPPRSVLVVDNVEYQAQLGPALDLLAACGYRRLNFWGVAPGELRTSCTAVFYRSGNCLGL